MFSASKLSVLPVLTSSVILKKKIPARRAVDGHGPPEHNTMCHPPHTTLKQNRPLAASVFAPTSMIETDKDREVETTV